MIRKLVAALVFGFCLQSNAMASPGFDFVCYERGMSATVGLDLEWSTAYLDISGNTLELPGSKTGNGSFSFGNGEYTFNGFPPDATLSVSGGVSARCFQSRDSLTALALYGADTNGKWPRFMAQGQGFQTVRSAPSPQAEKITSLDQGTPVLIIENTGQFLDGYFWFKISYGEDEQGYIWGALLCSDADEPVLNTVVRKCG